MRTHGMLCSYGYYEQNLHTRTVCRSPGTASRLHRTVPRRLPPPVAALLVRRLPPRPARGRGAQEHRTDGRPRPRAAATARHQGPRPGPAAIRQPEPLGRAAGPPALPPRDGPALRQPAGDLRHRRYRLPQAGQAVRRRAAPILRPVGQEGQLPGRRHGPLRRPRGTFPRGAAALPAPVVDGLPRTTRAGRRPGAIPPGTDQGPDRLGAARPGPWRGPLARRRGGHRCRLRGLPGLSRRRGTVAPVLYRGGNLGDGGLHRGAALGLARGASGPGPPPEPAPP